MIRKIVTVPLPKLIVYSTILLLVVVGLHEIAEDVDTGHWLNQDSIEHFIAQFGAFSYVAYVVIIALIALTPVTSSTLWLVAGYLFNPWVAIGLTVLAEALAGIGNFYIGKLVIGRYLDRGRFPRLAATVKNYTGKLNFPFIFMLSLIPVSTTNVTAYAASLSGMRLRQYLLPWVCGITALSTFIILLGHSASQHSPVWSGIIIALAVSVVWGAHRLSKRYMTKSQESNVQVSD